MIRYFQNGSRIGEQEQLIQALVRNGLSLDEAKRTAGDLQQDADKYTTAKKNFKDPNKIYNLGDLPEAVITPSEGDILSKNRLNEMFPNVKDYHQLSDYFYGNTARNGLSQNEQIDRLYQIYSVSGKPKLKSASWAMKYFPIYNKKMRYGARPNYNPFSNTIHIYDRNYPDMGNYIAELAHAYQFRAMPFSWDKLTSLPSDIKVNGKTGYERPTNLEYQAHSIIEPMIENYVSGNIKSFNQDRWNNILQNEINKRKSR